MVFKCNGCNETWPSKDNKMDEPSKYNNEGICPECYEEEDGGSSGGGQWGGYGKPVN